VNDIISCGELQSSIYVFGWASLIGPSQKNKSKKNQALDSPKIDML
jgi:hypothetical protein